MIENEATYTTYEVIYRLKNAKKMRQAYCGQEKETYERTVAALSNDSNLRYLSASVTETRVFLFD